jgi:small subunit ribosomal protein S5e
MSDIEESPIETYNDVEPEFTGDAATTEVKLFGKWSFDDIEVRDISLEVSIPVFFYFNQGTCKC